MRLTRKHLVGGLAAVLLVSCGGHVPPATAPFPHLASLPTEVRLPPIGRVHSALLVDGDPVWIVRTEDDEVRVLGARVRLEHEGNPRFSLAAFDPECACFRANAPVIWNLEGEISAYTEPDYSMLGGTALGIHRNFDSHSTFWMDRFDFERNGESILVRTRWRATEYASPGSPVLPRISEVSSPNLRCPESVPPVSLPQALAQPAGRRLRVSGRVLVHGGIARLCAPEDVQGDRCPDDAPPVYEPSSDVIETGTWEPRDAAGLVFPVEMQRIAAQTRRLMVRRAGDGFAEVSSEWCAEGRTQTPSEHSGPPIELPRLASTPTSCISPRHDASWVRTPLDADSGIWVEAPVRCEERERPNIRMLRVHGRGSRHISADETIPERCHQPGTSADACPEVSARALYRSILDALDEHNASHPTSSAHFSYGIGGCFDTGRSTRERLAVSLTDWRYADDAIRIVSEALNRWDLAETFWVSVEPTLCRVPG